VKVFVPQPEFATALTGLRGDLDVLVWSGNGPVPPEVAEVEFHVPAYTFDPATLEIMADMPGLRVVQLLTAGIEHVLPYLPAGVTLCNARGVHDASTAELAVALTLAKLRGLDDFARAMPAGDWLHDRRDALADKTVLIVGYGAIGAAIDRRLAGFEVDVLRVSRTPGPRVAGMDELPGLLARVDVVILSVPATAETRGLVNAPFLAGMRDGALLVNVSRGPIVDTDALFDEVRSGRLRAALDVTDPEPLPLAHPLWQLPGMLISPHVGGNTTAFLPRAIRLVTEQVRGYLAGAELRNIVVQGWDSADPP